MERVKAVILCGGRGTRMGQETESVPKPMVQIAGGRPILWHIMKIYSTYGVRDFVLCLGYKGDVIRSYFLNYGTFNCDFSVHLGRKASAILHNACPEDWTVTLAETGQDAMTGARLKRVEQHIDGDVFMMTYGDGVADVDVESLLSFHLSHKRAATVTGVLPPSRFGQLLTEGDSVRDFLEKPERVVESSYINGGFFVLNRSVFEYLTEDPECTFEREPLQRLARDGELAVYRHPGYWQCMDTSRDLESLSKVWASGAAPWKVWEG